MEQLLFKLILESKKHQATDIHFTINDQESSCELRSIRGFVKFESDKISSLFQYLKYCSDMDLGNHVVPQSGTFQKIYDDEIHYFRFSCISTMKTQTGVLRILNNHPPILLENCSRKKKQNQIFKRWCHLRSGLILFTGPTSSGKTTTLHALLEEIASRKQLKIITLEDPIEIISKNYLQLQINEKMNFTYEIGIQQLLRHDPDVIMIGEIRDEKCAQMVYRAALSGHLVFSTLHAKSSQEAVKRLNELGLDNVMLSETLTGIVNQRLYPDAKRKERVCIYEILASKELQDYLIHRKMDEKHKTIFDEIKDAVERKEIRLSDAKVDLLDL